MATAFAMTATERNTSFGPDAKQALPKNKKLIVYCGLGGTLKVGVKTRRGIYDDPDRSFGRESRSLKGAYELYEVSQPPRLQDVTACSLGSRVKWETRSSTTT